MRVALDARSLQNRPLDGIGRVLENVLPLLAADVEFELLTDARRPPVDADASQHALGVPGAPWSALWLQVAAPRWLRGFDGLFHCPFYGLPYFQPVPMVVSIYDVIYETNPEWYSRARLLAFRAQGRHAARTARRIITGSEWVRQQVVDRYRVDPARVVVVPCAIDPIFRPDGDSALRAGLLDRLGVGTPYVVALGGAPRRGLARAVDAWRLVRRGGVDVTLVVVGRETPPAEPGLIATGPLDDEGWAAVLAGAEALCYPTADEGFGFPALEAVASGTPVVCAPVGSLPEVLGEAAEWCESPTPHAIAAGLARVLVDRDRALDLRRVGLARAEAAAGWDHTAACLLRAYREAVE